jgi:LacI family transcriptional regulator, galactose operon repressor
VAGRAAKRATLDDVAQGAGVSKATASKVLNGRGGVSGPTRQRVHDVMKELRYQPSTTHEAGSPTVELTVLFDAFESPYAVQVLGGIVAAGLDMDVDVVATSLSGNHTHEPLSAAWLHGIAQKGHSGVIVVTTEVSAEAIEAAAADGIGLVTVDPVSARDGDDDGLVTVSATNWTGGYQATRHLLDLGHRRIGFAGGHPDSTPARHRLHGYRGALSAAGVAEEPRLIRQVGFTHTDGRLMAEQLLDLDVPPTAIVAGCDASALGVLAAARDRHLRVPEDLSVVGFDDTYMAESAAPPLTTVRQPLREMGRLAVRTVLALAQGERPDTHHFELATTLIVRESTAPPKSVTAS